MEVDRVKVALRYSQLTSMGNWKTVEIEATGTVSPNETWQQAQTYLYAELQRQINEIWKLPEGKIEPARVEYQPAAQAQPPLVRDPMDPEGIFEQPIGGPVPATRVPMDAPLAHWCVSHAQKFDSHTKGRQEWYSHKVEGTDSWCRE